MFPYEQTRWLHFLIFAAWLNCYKNSIFFVPYLTQAEAALTNTYVLAPPRMYLTPAECTDPPYERGAFMALGSKIKSFGKLQAPTITTTKQVNGAIAVFYPGVKEKIASMAGGSYYVAFTSIHEARIHCVNTVPPRTILSSIKRVNKAFDPEEILTRKVYYYDADKDTFDMLEL